MFVVNVHIKDVSALGVVAQDTQPVIAQDTQPVIAQDAQPAVAQKITKLISYNYIIFLYSRFNTVWYCYLLL